MTYASWNGDKRLISYRPGRNSGDDDFGGKGPGFFPTSPPKAFKMMFSTKAEYGVRVMVALAQRAQASPDGEEPGVPLRESAQHHGLPLADVEPLVARLRKAGLIESRRGSRGGYMLARAPREITMAEVVEALEGAIAQ